MERQQSSLYKPADLQILEDPDVGISTQLPVEQLQVGVHASAFQPRQGRLAACLTRSRPSILVAHPNLHDWAAAAPRWPAAGGLWQAPRNRCC